MKLRVLILLFFVCASAPLLRASDNEWRGVIRSGPVASELTPNWRFAVDIEYETHHIDIGVFFDLMLSKIQRDTTIDGERLRLASEGFGINIAYKLELERNMTLAMGSSFGIRQMAYRTESSAFFGSANRYPWFLSSDVGGSQVYTYFAPFVQYNYWFDDSYAVLARFGYDIHVGPDFADVTSNSLSGPYLQAGFKVSISSDD